MVSLILIHWVEIYLMDSASQLFNNWGLVSLCADKAKLWFVNQSLVSSAHRPGPGRQSMLISSCINLATTVTPAQQQQSLEYVPNTKIMGKTDKRMYVPYFTCLVLLTIIFCSEWPYMGPPKDYQWGDIYKYLQAFVNKCKSLVIHSLLMPYVSLSYTCHYYTPISIKVAPVNHVS